MRRFFRPSLRRPLPDFLVPMRKTCSYNRTQSDVATSDGDRPCVGLHLKTEGKIITKISQCAIMRTEELLRKDQCVMMMVLGTRGRLGQKRTVGPIKYEPVCKKF